MKTSFPERIFERARQLRAIASTAISSQAAVAGLLIFVLTLSLVTPFSARAERENRLQPTTPSSPASHSVLQTTETLTVYGPQRFTRNAGQPVNVIENFSLPADVIAPFAIVIENGAPSGSNRVSSATIKLNGTDLYTPNDFNQDISTLNKPVVLTSNNTLEVKLTSASGSYLTISFTAKRVASQPTLDSITPARTTQGQTLNVTLHGTNTHWVAGETRGSLGGEVAVGGAPYGEFGPVTVLNATTAIAAVVVSPTAALEPRTARVVTPPPGGGADESLALPESFTIDAATPPGAAAASVSTIAGGAGSAGFADGDGAQARFQKLSAVAIGPDDAIYVADSSNQRIRVVRGQLVSGTTIWTVSTLAGNGTAGFSDGPGASAQFSNPQGVAVDGAGVVYVADTANNRIRRIASDGTVSTWAGDGTPGFQNGAGTLARFNAPQGVATDSQGNVYVADTGNAAVRIINAGGTVSTLAGDGTVGSNDSPNARFDGLVGIAVEGQNVYVYLADTGNHRIRRLDVAGTVITVTGADRGFKDGSASEARFAEPAGIAIDGAGKIIIADGVNSLVRAVDPVLAASGSNQAVTTVAGTGVRGITNGTGDVARFFKPRGLAISTSSAIIVADTGNQVLRRILLPPIIHAINPPSARIGDTITINGERFDGRGPERNVVRFTRSSQAGGGQTFGSVTQATRTALTVVVPSDAATGPVTVETEGGTATSPNDFVVDNFPAPVITDFAPKRGITGTQVTLTGTNLRVGANDPAVTFAGSNGTRLPALISNASATEVRTTVPNGAITGLIELTHVGGTAATATPFTVDTEQDFQLTLAPSATTAVQGGSGTYVVYVTSQQSTFGQLVSLTATGLPAGITVTFGPEQITAGASSTLTLKLSGTITAGSYPFTIHGVASVGGSDLARTAGATLNVMTAGQTSLSGRVLSTDSEPIIGAIASLDGKTAMTDAAGSFLLTGVTAGTNRPLMVDGRTASSPNKTYPVIIEPANIVAGQANVNPYTFYLPPIDTQYEVEVVPGQNTVASNPRVPGLSMTIPAGANLRNRDNSPVTRVSITPLAIDRTPAPLPSNLATALVYTSQPGGAIADIPMPVVYPNLLGTNPGTQMNLYAFNHDTVQWYIYGTGTVSSDGRTIAPNINPSTGQQYGLPDFSWHFPGLPNAGQGGNPGCKGGCGCNGKRPVNYSTGIKLETSTDISFGGARGGLTLTRYYTSDNSGLNFSGRFGRGVHDNFDVTLTGTWALGGSGRVIMPDEQTGRLFNYARTDPDGTRVFTTTSTIAQLGDVVRRLTDGTLEYRYTDGRVMRFDAGGRMTAIVDPNGNTTTLTYTGTRLTRVTDAVGRSIDLAYNASGFVSIATDPMGRIWSYSYGTFGNFAGFLATVTDALENTTSYSYTNARLTSVIDARGNVVKTVTYDGNGRVIRQQFADGGIETYEYVLSGTIVTSTIITDPLGRKITKRFNANGYLVGSIDELGQSSQITLDIATNLPTATVGPCGCPEESRQFDARGNVTSSTDQLGKTVTYEYDPVFNHVTKKTDKNGKVYSYTYDSRGNLTSFTNPLDETTSYQVDAHGQVRAMTDGLGHRTEMEYDANGNMTAKVDPLAHRWLMEYDTMGRPTATVDPLGRRTETEYDAMGRVKKVTDTKGTVTQYEHDRNGNRTKVTDGLNHATTMSYDPKNRIIVQTDALGRKSRVLYNFGDEITQLISPSGRKTVNGYDSRGQLSSTTSPGGDVTRFSYDNRGNLLKLTDSRGNITTWTYDQRFRPVSGRNPLGKITSIEYDSQNNIVKKLDKLGRQTTITYDPLNRIQEITFPDAQVTYGYDHAGRLETVVDTQGGTISYAYDDANRLTSETTAQGVVAYEYNNANQRSKMTAADRLPVLYGYDPAGRAETISRGNETFSLEYDLLSRRKSLTRPNGIVTNYAYDEASRLKRLTHKLSQQAVEDYQYTYSLDGEIDSTASLASGTVLAPVKNAGPADAANRISQIEGVSYSFDDLGQAKTRTDSNGTTSYDWDARGRLIRATPSSGQAVTYSYDAFGRRSSRATSGITTSFLYDGQDVVLDRATDGSLVDYVNGLKVDERLKQAGNSGAFYFLNDHLNSVQMLTEAAGNTVEHKSYEAFGDSANGSLTRYGYTGREKDDAAGLIYYRARWYDAYSGRFASEDPSGFKGGDLNLYAYVGNNPLLYTDPSGMRRCHPLLGALAGGLMGAGAGGLIGTAVGGGGGAVVGGGAGTLVFPGVGTIAGGGGGAVVGGIGGAGIGVIVGGGIGAGIGYIFCSGGDDAIPDTVTPKPDCPDDPGDRCMKNFEQVDLPMCDGVGRARGREAYARCHASAVQRLAACLRGLPLPPLDVWNN